MPIEPNEPYYKEGGISTGCNNGSGFVNLYGILTDSRVTLYVYLMQGATVLDSVTFPPNTGHGGYTFSNVANGDYTIKYDPLADGVPLGAKSVATTVYCEAIPEPEPDPEPQPECVASYPFIVEGRRGPRYIMEFDELDGTTHTFTWDLLGYTGEPEYLCGSGEPATIEWQGTGNKTDVLHGSSASITLLIDNNDALLRDFHTSDERKYKVSHYIEGVLHWTGWHMADIYNTPWDRNTFHATIQAYDGIASLNNKPYLNSNGVRYYGRARAIDVIFRCLRLLDLDIPVWLGVNVWEDTTDLNVEPLAQVYVDQSAYYDEDNEPLSCGEVLERILQPYNAFVKQAKGSLHILRYNEVQGPYQRRLANIGRGDSEVQVGIESEEFEELIEIRYDSETEYRESAQAIYAKPAYKEVTTITHYGPYENFVFNGDFERWANRFTPLKWEIEEGLVVEQMSDGEKFVLLFPTPDHAGTRAPKYIKANAYDKLVQSSVGFTVKVDFQVTVDDYNTNQFYFWVEPPSFVLSGNTLTLENEPGFTAKGSFDGVEVEFPNGTIQSGIPTLSDPQFQKRTDLAYALADGTITYVTGTVTDFNAADEVPLLPAGALPITYITFGNGQDPVFSSVSPAMLVIFPMVVKIGDYYARKSRATGTRGEYYTADNDPQDRYNTASWVTSTRGFGFTVFDFDIKSGYAVAKGTFEFNLNALEVPGLPELHIGTPYINRNTLQGVEITIDNIVFQERQMDNVERMLITGTNEGHINTEPFEVDLYHGSGIPRVEALLTLQDGTPANTFNNGKLLQENTARDILTQHSKALLTLTATTTAGISPISVVKDFNLLYNRFFIDKFVYSVKRNHVSFEAIEVLGGIDELPPVDCIITEDGRPIVTQDFKWVVKEQ